MLCIRLENNDPYFCLAAEEYLLKNFTEDIFMLWQSHDTVVVGKHQNLLAEINYRYCRENNIALARRISGGGTVFHDHGNVNFSFIKNVAGPHDISFQRFTEPIRKALKELGVNAETSGRNDLLVGGKKISGNAEHVYKNRVLHHGTLLFNSDLKNLGQAIKVVPGKYQSKAVQSNRSQVANISSSLEKEMGIDEFIRFLLDFHLLSPENSVYCLTGADIQHIKKSVAGKFSTFEWQFGYSPAYSFKNEIKILGKQLNVELSVKQGLVENCRVSGDFLTKEEAGVIGTGLQNKRHLFDDVRKIIEEFSLNVSDDLAYTFF